jgi:transcriptional regulator with XRE-family HTH domain
MKKEGKAVALCDRRRRRLRAALAMAGGTVAEFAAELGVSHSHLNYVLRGLRASPRIEAAIEKRIRAVKA